MNVINIVLPEKIGKINPNIYGHFVEHLGGVIYDGIWVGEQSAMPNIRGFRKSLIDLLKKIDPPVIRWPGGCFAESYNWRDGIGPKSGRPKTVGWWYNNESRLESNEVGTHEFMDFCRLVGAEPYFAANATTTTPLEIRNWVEYCNFPENSTTLARQRAENGGAAPFNVKYWGIGNENWGYGGNMTPEDYCAAYRKYSITAYSADKNIRCVACGPSDNDLKWTRRFFDKLRDATYPELFTKIAGYSAHYYCGTTGDALVFDENQWYELLLKACYMEEVVVAQRALMDSYDPERAIGLIVDEWGCWHPEGSGPSKGAYFLEQQSTMRDALVAALTLNIFNNHCDKVVMANLAQLVNNLHSLFLANGENLIVTPNYHVFDMFKGHQNGTALRSVVETDRISFTQGTQKKELDRLSCSSSIKNNKLTVTIVNSHYSEDAEIELRLFTDEPRRISRRTVLMAPDPHMYNTFEEPGNVKPEDIAVDSDRELKITAPAASVTLLEVDFARDFLYR